MNARILLLLSYLFIVASMPLSFAGGVFSVEEREEFQFAQQEKELNNVLMKAVRGGDAHGIAAALFRGADPAIMHSRDQQRGKWINEYPLTEAAARGHTEIVKLLVYHVGAKAPTNAALFVQKAERNGLTPLKATSSEDIRAILEDAQANHYVCSDYERKYNEAAKKAVEARHAAAKPQ